jgi:hypothetical protein
MNEIDTEILDASRRIAQVIANVAVDRCSSRKALELLTMDGACVCVAIQMTPSFVVRLIACGPEGAPAGVIWQLKAKPDQELN